jgi:hypothetical protein
VSIVTVFRAIVAGLCTIAATTVLAVALATADDHR